MRLYCSPKVSVYLSRIKTRGSQPWFLLTGDTLFVGAVGRPDLPGHMHESAGQLYDSLNEKIA